LYILAIITTPNIEESEKIAHELLKRRLTACVNIIPLVKSRYWWKGNIESDDESLIIVKSKKELFDELLKTVKTLHSYEVPEIISFQIQKGYKDYLSWIEKSVKNIKRKSTKIPKKKSNMKADKK
jgi:periplasmic divalent cation tolerance protein